MNTTVRWIARILSGAMLLFCGVFLVSHLFGDGGRASRPLVMQDYVSIAALLVLLLGHLLAWKWELPGAVITLAGFAVIAAFNWKLVLSPFLISVIAAALFLWSWQLHRGAGSGGRQASPQPS